MEILVSDDAIATSATSAGRRVWRPPTYGRLSQAMAFFQLGHMLRAGVAIDVALAEVQHMEPRRAHRRIWQDVRQRLDQGEALSAALARWQQVFEPSVIALIRAGEASGQLDTVLQRLDDQLRWQHAVAQRLMAVMSYPLLACALVLLVSWFLLGSVVPSMAGFLESAGAGLSWHASVLLTLSNRVEHAGSELVVLLLLMGLIGFAMPVPGGAVRQLRDLLLVRMPIVGDLIAALSCARYCRTLAMLSEHGVRLDKAMKLSEGVATNDVVRMELVHVRVCVLAGNTLAQGLEHSKVLPSTTRRMIAAGERAGALNQALHRNADQLQASAGFRIERIERLIGPLLMIVLGGLLMWIIVSILLPVYDVALQAGAL